MINKIIAVLLITTLLLGKGAYFVYAEDAQGPVEAEAPVEAVSASDNKPPKEDKSDKGTAPVEAVAPDEAESLNVPEPTPEATQTTYVNDENESGNQESDKGIGDASIETGDANNNGAIYTNANSNLAGIGGGTGSGLGGVSIVNADNGSSSNNNGSANIVGNNNTDQNNSAVILNNMTQASVTGDNSASKNTNGNSSIATGDANVSGTVITSANTNVDGVAISEFNIVEDHFGDYVLDFGANCIAGCTPGSLNIANTGNGSNSDNNGDLNNTQNNTTNQNNDGTVINNVDFVADSGNNDASKNTGGDSSITTGDANVAANLVTFLNNNIAGGVMFGVVNIFGELIGDIIMPDNVFDQFNCGSCSGGANIANTGNGSNSSNNGAVNDTLNNNVFQSNDANITNNLFIDAETGENNVTKNTDGNNSITTGNTNVDASILNIANMNLLGGNMWLVLVNEAGNWVGKLFGAPEGSMIAGADGMEFAYDSNGQINVTNANNGSGSENSGTVNNTTNNDLNQTNTANVVNNVNLFANTGGNTADKNTGGNSSIITGDAEAIANIVNFVNNNIAGGKLLVTFVNVFGSWDGDFLTPGSNKDKTQNQVNNVQNNSENNGNNNKVVNGGGVVGVASLVAAITNIGNQNSADVSENINPDQSVKVAGIAGKNNETGLTLGVDTDNKNASINLAWVLFALPLAGLLIVARKRYLKRSI